MRDHPALEHAAARGGVVALFVIDDAILRRRHHQSPHRLAFLRASLQALDEELRSRGSRLVVRRGDAAAVVPQIAHESGADLVVATVERSPLGVARDRAVEAALAEERIGFRRFGGDLVVDVERVPGPHGNGYQVFTPFWRAWSQHAMRPIATSPPSLPGPVIAGTDLSGLGSAMPPIPAGSHAAHERLERFVRSGAADRYEHERDLLGAEGTSRLSVDLRFGAISPGEVGRALALAEHPERLPFWRQVAWREFYHHLMARRPEIMTTAMRPAFRAIVWERDPAGWEAWTAGHTGVPIVDAAMRQLAQTGWMHNRGRMVAASFLVKDLLIDWRRGETHFMRHLVDGDPANNNGGWQWTAGTGADAAPYFRVFNPTAQGKRFDPDGAFVRRWVPELRRVPDALIHEPWRMDAADQSSAGCRIGVDYPAPIVDHAERRLLAIARYRDAERRASVTSSADRD